MKPVALMAQATKGDPVSEPQMPPPADETELDLELVHGGLPRRPMGPKGGITGCIPGCVADTIPVEDEG